MAKKLSRNQQKAMFAKNRGLNIRKGKRKGEWSVYKYDSPLFTGLKNKSYAEKVMKNQKKHEDELRKS